MSSLEGLNERQHEAATTTEGPLLIIAGAGAGKTKTLVSRIAHLIENGVAPHAILAITFTNKAAREMRERVTQILKSSRSLNTPVTMDETPFVSTFHALGVHILRASHKAAGIPKNFTIYDRADSKRRVRDALKEANYDPKQFEPGKILGIISRAKGEAQDYDTFAQSELNSPTAQAAAQVWPRYAEQLHEEGALDFDDLLLRTLQLLEQNKDVREHYQHLWQHVSIDEYQDTNHVQYRIARILAEPQRNICAIGDTDQLIYGWRGAKMENILGFERDYTDTKTVALEENYRSTKTIIEAANRVIEKNQYRQSKRLFTQNAAGELITVAGFRTETAEATYIAETAANLIRNGTSANEIAVLYRTNVQSRALEEAMLERDVPYQLLGTKFFERKEVKDVLGYLKAALNPNSRADFSRIANTPTRGVGKATMLKMLEGRDNELSARQKKAADTIRAILENIRQTAQAAVPSELVGYVIRESGLDVEAKKEHSEDAEERRANMYELAALAQKYDQLGPEDGLNALLENAALASDQDQLEKSQDAIKLMTVHAAKGLEFDNVFVAGLESDLFPQTKEDEESREEERRLFYVALTRARHKLYLTYALQRTIFGQRELQLPSEFLEDIDDTLAERDEPQQFNGGGLLDDDPIVRIEF